MDYLAEVANPKPIAAQFPQRTQEDDGAVSELFSVARLGSREQKAIKRGEHGGRATKAPRPASRLDAHPANALT